MSETNPENLPVAQSEVPSWISGIPKALIPSSLKAFNRLLGAAFDYPVALIRRETAKVEAQTKAFEVVEAAIAKSAGELAGADAEIVDRALKVLVRKEYRKQTNREAVAAEAVRELETDQASPSDTTDTVEPLSEDWLNVFERFAEDASTERMQGLWGRVLAGELRQPGKFSLRTLRFLSEFSQSDAVLFAEICESAVGQAVLKSLAIPDGTRDIRHLLQLEAAGLITGATGLGLENTLTFDETGHTMIQDGALFLIFRGEPNTFIKLAVIGLTPLGLEVMSLIPSRDSQSVIRRFAHAARSVQTKAAFIGHQAISPRVDFIEQLWVDAPTT